MSLPTGPRRLVLVGAGHAHLEVLRRWSRPPEGVELTVVVDRPASVYSGMVPGLVAGQYREEELTVPAAPVVASAGGRLVEDPLAGIDPAGRRLFLASGAVLPYDVASLDVGSRVAGHGVPGVEEHAVPTRPLSRLLEALGESGLASSPGRGIVVGGGAAGVELAAALAARLGGEGGGRDGADRARPRAVLVEADARLLAERSASVAEKVRTALERRGVEVRTDAPVAAVEPDGVRLADGSRIDGDPVVWAAGAAPLPVLAGSPLPADARGFVRVRPTLQVAGHPDLFAAGDCASPEGREVPRAGVHAVRQGPVLAHNLEARLGGRPLRRYEPQADFLTLLNLGDGTALGTKWGFALSGRWVFRLKDLLDRRFVARVRG